MLLLTLPCGGGVASLAAQVVAPVAPRGPAPLSPIAEADVVQLEKVEIEAKGDQAGFDRTGLGSNESQLYEAPFSNDLVRQGLLDDDPAEVELKFELGQVRTASAVDLATGDTRLSLRGFPAPLLRNGFVHLGMPDLLNTARLLVIQGPL
eukprot:gene58150-79644_t